MPESIDLLIDKHRGDDVYVLGTGASMRVTPYSFLHGRTIIGLNQSWRFCPLTYCISLKNHNRTAHETARATGPANEVKHWILREAPGANEVDPSTDGYTFWADESKNGYWEALTNRRPGELFYRAGSQTSAIHLAVLMGARSVILVGNDMRPLDGEHHGFLRHGNMLGPDRSSFYGGYQRFTRELQSKVRDLFGVPIITMMPYIGLDDIEEQHRRIKAEMGLEPLWSPKEQPNSEAEAAQFKTNRQRYPK